MLTNATSCIGTFGLFAVWLMVPFYAESAVGFGSTPTEAALYLLPGSLLGLSAGFLSALIGGRYGSKWPLALGTGSGAAGSFLLAGWHSSGWHLLIGATVVGAFFPLTFAANANLIVESVEPSETGIASGVNMVTRTIGSVLAAQVSAAILASQTVAGSATTPRESAFTLVFLIGGAGATFATGLALLITRRRAAGLVVLEAR
jgi:hypothetical protein